MDVTFRVLGGTAIVMEGDRQVRWLAPIVNPALVVRIGSDRARDVRGEPRSTRSGSA